MLKAATESFAFSAVNKNKTAKDAKSAEGIEVRLNTQSFTKIFAVSARSAVNKNKTAEDAKNAEGIKE